MAPFAQGGGGLVPGLPGADDEDVAGRFRGRSSAWLVGEPDDQAVQGVGDLDLAAQAQGCYQRQ
ncbi:hypothetical protein STENM327S_01633 [Streptomyces tendae]